ncbi:ABC transporter permease [Haloactinomyces albus]|uniref:NitT/TauT family transport system permease protein n=1 Tax=Haloactinomyces albus TaxID=1352928 RepID=A0AAE3ZCX4_9ACTN|nr:ABC transporter permease [Haloactinomyces albus]MDR7301535.1 NitT/TauT family transport system permease protein [Haloactinomyces albus]
MRHSVRALIGVAGFLGVCEIVGRSGLAPQEYLPPPSIVLTELARLLGERTFLLDVIATMLAWLIALSITAVIAVPAGLLLGSVPMLRNAVGAVVEFLRPIPSVALIPLVLVIAGGGPDTKIFLAVYAAVWPLLFNTIYALGEIDDQLIDSTRAFNISRREVLLRVTLPSVTPFVLTGLRLSASTALIVLISTEMLAPGSGGIGHFIYLASSGAGRMDQVLAGTLVAGMLGYLINAGMAGVQRRWVTWAPAGGTT